MEVRLTLDDVLMDEMKTKTGISDPLALTADALKMLHWAINEISSGRIVVSTDVSGGNVKILRMQSFYNIEQLAIRDRLPANLHKDRK